MIHVYKPTSDWHKRSDMTEGEKYDCRWNNEVVYSSDGVYYELTNDRGEKIEVHESHLIPLDEWRSGRLKKIGIYPEL